MKQRFTASLVALGALALVGSAARADLTLNGEVGLPLNPTAQIPQQGGFRLQANYYKLFDDSFGGTDVDGKVYSLAGAITVAKKVEINGAIHSFRTHVDNDTLQFSDSDSQTGFSLGAKYLITQETSPAGVRIAAGAGVFHTDDLRNERVYVVASKSLRAAVAGKAPITGHAGLRYDHYKVDVAGDNSSNRVSAYVGAEVPVLRSGDVQLVGEIGTKQVDDGKSPYSVSLRYRPSQKPFGASVGFARQGAIGDSDPQFFAQIGYTFGK